MRRLLSCSLVPLDPRLGMGKHVLESAQALRTLGWTVEVVGPEAIAGGPLPETPESLSLLLRTYLRRVAGDYDIVEYDHVYLPFPRTDFDPRPLFVARCMLLHHHFLTTPLPLVPRLRSRLANLIRGRKRRQNLERVVAQTDLTVRHADLTVVSNDRDAAALVRNGADPHRITVLPLGLTEERLRQLEATAAAQPDQPVVGFVGTFDPRKGMCEFPQIVERVAARIPQVRFRLLGTAGMIADADGVRSYFPRKLWSRLEIRPRYDPAELPNLLAEVTVGVFPSRVESFGYGVLEMMAARIPVVAYDAPGPHTLLPADLLVPVGDFRAMASLTINLLSDPARLTQSQREVHERARNFRWDEVATRTARVYLQAAQATGRPRERCPRIKD